MVSGEAGGLAEILVLTGAVSAFGARRIEPGHADSIALFKSRCIIPLLFNNSDDLMSGDDGQFHFRKFAFDSVEICMADAADFDAEENILKARFWDREINELERILIDRRKFFELHGFHRMISSF